MASGSIVAVIKLPAVAGDTEKWLANNPSKGCGAYKTKKINTEQSNKCRSCIFSSLEEKP
ncbi:hypothetical protein GCM10008027_25500 [Pseudoalteromonas gelatinilytica]|uniref:Uncharacterized protein n=1 Tax=Pseudoalteromonas gelatinilytica TaxID=1703256 RepID=A0ABQ1TN91_9GAMM|nr:hypothetical protein GCM10008027_25500 [Pseudoalteromonas profundi]